MVKPTTSELYKSRGMFKKSLMILLSCGLLTLAGIVAFAVAGGRGPEDTIREAQAKLAAGEYASVISLLDQAEYGHSLKGNRNLTTQLRQLRKVAHAELDNPAGALLDVQALLADGYQDDVSLQLDQIRYLAQDKQGELALIAARRFLATYPDDGRGLELAGEACQTAYQPMLVELRQDIDRELGAASRASVDSALLTFLYRPAGDREVKQAGTRLEQLFSADPRLLLHWPIIWSKAQQLRERIQEALGYYQRSLDLGNEPVAAFRAVIEALEQSGRIDDLFFACEVQRRLFDHAFIVETGAINAWVCLQNNLPEAAIAAAKRWLPLDQVEPQAEAGILTASSEQLALARALASWRIGSLKEMAATGRVIDKLRENDVQAILALHVSLATRRISQAKPDYEKIESSLGIIVRAASRVAPQPNRPDLVAEFAPLLIDRLLARAAPEEEVTEVLAMWREGRPNAIEPRIRNAEYLLAVGRTAASLEAIAYAAEIDPNDPALFPLHLKVARRHSENTQQSGESLLQQCVENSRYLPDASDPIGFVLCAEAALNQKNRRYARIALLCARSAAASFPRANIPRQLELRALLLNRQYEEAARSARLSIDSIEPDPETLKLAFEAKRMAGQPLRDLLRIAMPHVASNPSMQFELLRLAFEDAPRTSVQFVTDEMNAKDAPVLVRAMVIRALTAAGRLEDAKSHLQACPNATTSEEKSALIEALSAWLLAVAETGADSDLLAILKDQHSRLGNSAAPQSVLLDIATKLADEHPKTSFEILNRALAEALPEERTGKLYILAGNLALAHQDVVRAEAYWTAALGFADGVVIAERLARLHLLMDKEERALKVYALAGAKTDGALAIRLGYASVGRELLATALKEHPSDLLTHATLASLGQEALVDWGIASDVTMQTLRLTLLAGLADPRLGMLTMPRAEMLLSLHPELTTHSLLVARAMADARQSAAAGTMHSQLFKAGYMGPVLWREVAYAGQGADYATSPELMQAVMTAVTSGSTGGSQLTATFGMQQVVKTLELAGMHEVAAKSKAMQWTATPQMMPCTSEDLEFIASNFAPHDICLILDQVLQAKHEIDRIAVLEAFYQSASKALVSSPIIREQMMQAVRGHLIADGAQGQIVHFLLDNGIDLQPAFKRQILVAHLEQVATGLDGVEHLDDTIKAMTKSMGLAGTIRAIEDLINRYPTALDLWSIRAELRLRADNDLSALEELRTVLTHADNPPANLTYLGMAAAQRMLTPEDAAQLDTLTEELLASPKGEYVQALLAARKGAPDEAVDRFLKAEPQSDGRHLYELALVYLQSNKPDAIAKSIAALKELRTNYPNSSLAQNAGSFVRQLSPRSAKAAVKDENR